MYLLFIHVNEINFSKKIWKVLPRDCCRQADIYLLHPLLGDFWNLPRQYARHTRTYGSYSFEHHYFRFIPTDSCFKIVYKVHDNAAAPSSTPHWQQQNIIIMQFIQRYILSNIIIIIWCAVVVIDVDRILMCLCSIKYTQTGYQINHAPAHIFNNGTTCACGAIHVFHCRRHCRGINERHSGWQTTHWKRFSVMC